MIYMICPVYISLFTLQLQYTRLTQIDIILHFKYGIFYPYIVTFALFHVCWREAEIQRLHLCNCCVYECYYATYYLVLLCGTAVTWHHADLKTSCYLSFQKSFCGVSSTGLSPFVSGSAAVERFYLRQVEKHLSAVSHSIKCSCGICSISFIFKKIKAPEPMILSTDQPWNKGAFNLFSSGEPETFTTLGSVTTGVKLTGHCESFQLLPEFMLHCPEHTTWARDYTEVVVRKWCLSSPSCLSPLCLSSLRLFIFQSAHTNLCLYTSGGYPAGSNESQSPDWNDLVFS